MQIGPLIEFFIGQFIIFSPIIFLIFLVSLIKNWHLFHTEQKLLNLKECHCDLKESGFFLLFLVFQFLQPIFFLSLISETEINWASPISIPIVIYFSTLVAREQKNSVQTKFHETCCSDNCFDKPIVFTFILKWPKNIWQFKCSRFIDN